MTETKSQDARQDTVIRVHRTTLDDIIRKVFDLLISLLSIIILSPVIIILTVIIMITGNGQVI